MAETTAKRGPGGRPYRYEVDLAMLPKEATTASLLLFCHVLQRIMDEDGTDLAEVVSRHVANNERPPNGQKAWGWPSEHDWEKAVGEVFGTEVV